MESRIITEHNIFVLAVVIPFTNREVYLTIYLHKKLNLIWLKSVRDTLNKMLYEFNWFDLRNKLFRPLKWKIQHDCPYLRDEEKWNDFMDNGYVYLTNTDDDERTSTGMWYAPTLENLFAGRELDF